MSDTTQSRRLEDVMREIAMTSAIEQTYMRQLLSRGMDPLRVDMASIIIRETIGQDNNRFSPASAKRLIARFCP